MHYMQACGHTFAGLNPEFSPKMSLTASSITFPACNPGGAAAQTLGLRNYGDTPVHFSLSVVGLSAGARVLVEPQQGVVPPQTMQLVRYSSLQVPRLMHFPFPLIRTFQWVVQSVAPRADKNAAMVQCLMPRRRVRHSQGQQI